MRDAFPLAPQLCPGDRTAGIAPAGGLGLELVDQGIELAPGPIGEPAEVQFLNAVGKPILEIAPAQHRWLAVEQLAPHAPQLGRGLVFSAAICARIVSVIAGLSPLSAASHARFARARSPVESLRTGLRRSSITAAQAHESSSQDLPQLSQALVGRHQIGRQSVGAGKAAIGIVKTETGLCAHLAAARSRYPVSLWGDPPEPRFCSIQPRTVSGSLSSSRAMSSSERPSPCRRTASACRLRYALVRQGVEQ